MPPDHSNTTGQNSQKTWTKEMMIRISKSKWMSGRHVYQDERLEENLWPPFRLIKKIMVNSNLYFSNVKKKQTNKRQ